MADQRRTWESPNGHPWTVTLHHYGRPSMTVLPLDFDIRKTPRSEHVERHIEFRSQRNAGWHHSVPLRDERDPDELSNHEVGAYWAELVASRPEFGVIGGAVPEAE
jgi:hypothetical protein